MLGNKNNQKFEWWNSGYSVAVVGVLLILAIIGILVFTVKTAQDQQLDNVIVDLAGEQDTLSQQYLKEVLLRSHGAQVDHHVTHQSLSDMSWEVLTNGGSMVVDPRADVNIIVPPAPNAFIRDQLHQQKALIDEFTRKANQFLQLPLNDAQCFPVRWMSFFPSTRKFTGSPIPLKIHSLSILKRNCSAKAAWSRPWVCPSDCLGFSCPRN